MCGIAGLIGSIARRDVAERMLIDMRHRGPDAKAVWADQNANLLFGHLRLSIIDLATGDQPMTSPDERYTIIYNGEIFNYIELKPALEQRGWAFRTTSDTEVLLAGLILEGPQFLAKTNGMFALAVWDRRERELLLARDRMGVKPLYYTQPRPGDIAFASDVKALLELPEVGRGFDRLALDAYLALRYVPGPHTIFQKIKKFPAAHWAIYRSGKLHFTKYWQATFQSGTTRGWSKDRAAEELESILADAVRLRLRSDVPYGAFLSGGIDSATIVALMTRYASEPVRTYSIGFAAEMDEREDARRIAERLGTHHDSIELVPEDFRKLEQVAWAVDEPFPDPIVLAMTTLAQRARRDVKVILTGEGADELFGGYVHHPHLLWLSRMANILPQGAWSAAGALAGRVPSSLLERLFNYPQSVGPQIRQRLADLLGSAKDETARYLSYVSLFTEEERRQLVNPMFRPGGDETLAGLIDERLTRLPGRWIDRLWTFEHRHWLTDNILFKQDKTLMAESIEGREPYCDYRLVEFAARLPVEARLRGGQNKVLLRAAARRIMPDLPAPSGAKRAFVIPLTGRYGDVLREMAGDVLNSTSFRDLDIFSRASVDELLAAFPNPSMLAGRKIMSLMMFALWNESLARMPARAAT